jgi:hypothetical protein
MSRQRFAITLAIALVGYEGTAHAQYYYPAGEGYGGYGFGGWGQTVQGSIAAGMGAFAQGAGQYNYETSVARSINANTAMQWNNYVWAAQHSLNVEHAARLKQERKDLNTRADAIQQRIRDNPTEVDIDRGDALNAVLEQLTYPKVLEGSGLARATGQISAETIKQIPFRYAPEMAVICVEGLRNNIPDLLMSDEVKPEREAFAANVKKGLAQIKAGEEVSPETVEAVRSTGKALWTKVEKGLPNASSVEREKALTYLRNLKAYLKMLKSPDFDRALRDLDKYKSTTVGNLLAFMHTYNLRFGPAKTQEQVALYRKLYPMLRSDRDRILSMLGSSAAAPTAGDPSLLTNPPPPPGIFHGVEDKHLGDSGSGQ